jgi:hypothetical protein
MLYFRGHGVHHEMESEGPSQKYGSVIDEEIPKMNRVGLGESESGYARRRAISDG